MLNSSGESGHPCLVPDFRGNAFNSSPLRIMFCCGFIIYGFYYVEVCSFYACFLEGFIINGCWILSKAFSASIEIIIWFLSFNFLELFFYHKWMLNFAKGFLCIYWDNHMVFISQFVNVVYYIDWFADIKKILAFLE